MKIISHQFIKSLNISPKQCTDWVLESFAQKQEAQLPAKISVHPYKSDYFTSMPCLLKRNETETDLQFFGVKEVYRIENQQYLMGSDMMLYNAINGELLAFVDCDWITKMRTGAVTAIAAKTLRKTDATTYGFVGLGNIARAAMLCILENEPDKHFNVKLLRYKNQVELFIERFKEYDNVSFDVVEDITELANKVDVLISCITSANGLLIEDESIFPAGITLIPVHMRGFQNCDTTFDRIIGDDTNHIKGFKYFSQYKNYNELGEILKGNDPGRQNNTQRILSYNCGLALHDVFFASKIYKMAEKMETPSVKINKEQKRLWI